MKHSDLMILHKLKYKHIGMMLLIIGAISLKWTYKYFNVRGDLILFMSAIGSLICTVLLCFIILHHMVENWNKTVL